MAEIFDVRNTHCVQKTWIEDFDGTVPYVTASSENNSIDSYVDYRPEMIDKGNAIVIGGKTFVVTYQKHDFFSNDSHNLILRLKRKACSELAYLFLVAVINRGLGSKYSWGDSVSFRKIQKDKVTLPVTANGDIDIAYMDAYIRELESAHVRKLEKYLNAAGLNDCELTRKEKLAVESCRSGKMKTGEFVVGDLFVVKSNPQLNKESFKFTNTSEYPYFTRTVFNNGILGKVDYFDEAHKINGGSLAVGMLGMQFFYMEHDFYAGQFTKTVFLKDGGRLDEKLALWFASLFNKSKGHFQKGLVRDFERLFLSLRIQLPVKPNGNPDFDTMRDLISGVMKLSIRGVVEWKDGEIAAAKKVVAIKRNALQIIERPPKAKQFVDFLPVWSFKVACGKNWKLQPVDRLGWIKCEHVGRIDKTMFVVQAEGNSMEGLVEEGEYCLMRKLGGGSLRNKILLIQEYDAAGPDDGGAFALKKFTRKGKKVVLVSRNPDVADIVLEDDGEYSVKYRAIAEFKGKIRMEP